MYEIWVAEVTRQPLEALLDMLSEKERLRASSFRFPKDRARFVVAHALKRHCLALNLDSAEPKSLHFAALAFGKPILVNKNTKCHFSMSHSGERCAVAVSDEGRCGVDIEFLDRSRALPDALRRAMTQSEWHAVKGSTNSQKEFVRRWVLKEAYAKWIGLGLYLDFENLCTENIHWIDRAFGSFEGTPCWSASGGPFLIAACGRGLAGHRVSRFDTSFVLPSGFHLSACRYVFSS